MTSDPRPAAPASRDGKGAGASSVEPMPLGTQLFRFVVTGGLSACIDLGTLALLQNVLGVHYVVAKTISFILGTTTAYLINRRWTFRSDGSRSKFAAVMALYAVTFAVQVGLYAVLVPWFRSLHWQPLLITVVSFVIAQGVATTVNFIVQRTVIFRDRPAA